MMRKIMFWAFNFFVASVLFFAVSLQFAHAADIEVSGAGTTAVNGCYTEVVAGEKWVLGDNEYTLSDTNFYWAGRCSIVVGDGTTEVENDIMYFGPSSEPCVDASTMDAMTWNDYTLSDPPSPDFAECAAPPEEGADNSATSTIEQTQQNLSTVFFLFLLSMFGMLWLIRK